MAEEFVLAAPEVIPQISTSVYRVIFIAFDWENATIIVRLRGENREMKEFIYGGSGPNVPPADKTKALAMMRAMAKADFSTKSLPRRVLEQLVSDGLLAGTVTGTPD